MNICTEEEFLARNGAGRQQIGDAALHKNRGRHSDKSWKRLVDRQAHEDHALICRRAELRKEFRALVALGEMREPTALEQRIATANGHPDLEATQAARRLLARRGIDWQTNGGPA